MVASVLIREKNGVGETATDKTAGDVRFQSVDTSAVDIANPVRVPNAGQKHSFEKWLRLQIGATAPSSQISNLEVYTDGANGFGTGINFYYAADATYSTPVAPSVTDAIPLHDTVAMVDAFGLTSAAPLSLGTGPFSTANTDMGDYLVLVMTVASTAGPGITPSETITFAYDEI